MEELLQPASMMDMAGTGEQYLEFAGTLTPVQDVAPQADARLVEYAPQCFAALPPHTTYALIDDPDYVEVPGAPPYAYGLMAWEGAWLPLIDLGTLLQDEAATEPLVKPRFALIVAYQCIAYGPVEYGAIGLAEPPQFIKVSDDAQCELPEDSKRWSQLALSCFRHEGRAVPILDTSRLLAASHRY